MAITTTVRDGIAEVVMHHPPVNALTVADTWAIRDAFAGPRHASPMAC